MAALLLVWRSSELRDMWTTMKKKYIYEKDTVYNFLCRGSLRHVFYFKGYERVKRLTKRRSTHRYRLRVVGDVATQ